MKLKTLVIDDEPIALEKLRAYVEKVPFLSLEGRFDNSPDALDFLGGHDTDLIITDIEMPDLNGMEMIRSLDNAPLVIFTTAYEQYAVESYRVRSVDYLLKPYSFADFQRAANRALEVYSRNMTVFEKPRDKDRIFVKTDTRYIKVDTADILYIKGFGEYLQIFVKERSMPLVTLSSFSAVKEHLSGDFVQIHRSYIVNMRNIEVAERSRVLVEKDTWLPVGDSYREAYTGYLSTHTVGGGSGRGK